jgi:hypothetical protein
MPDRPVRVKDENQSSNQDSLERNNPDPLLRPRLGSVGMVVVVIIVVIVAGLVAYGWGR